MRLRVRVAPGPQHLYGEESLFAAYPHLTGTSFVLQFASLLVGRGFCDFLVWGVAEMIAIHAGGGISGFTKYFLCRAVKPATLRRSKFVLARCRSTGALILTPLEMPSTLSENLTSNPLSGARTHVRKGR